MFIVAVTGGIATGKSTVLSIFREHGVAVIDADAIARNVLKPGTKAWHELKDYFGHGILLPDGQVNRARLSQLVLEDIEKRNKLNAITHHRIQYKMIFMALGYFFSGHRYVVIEVPLLFETGRMLRFMHKIITVVCEHDQQLQRLCTRNDMRVTIAKKKVDNQLPLKYKMLRSNFVIHNSEDLISLRFQTESIIRTLKKANFTWYFRMIVMLILLCAAFAVGYMYRKC